MGTSDGYIIGTTKIVDHGAASQRWSIIILGDGYRASEMTKYHTDVQNFVDHLYATAPFNEVWCGINIYRVDVASTDSGAKDPTTCGDGTTGSGASPATYFDASFCNSGIRRLLEVNTATALNVASTQVPQVHMTFVIVNSSIYGGSGGQVAVFSTAPSANEIGIHEMGHTAFGLADEYEYYAGCGSGETGHDHYAGGEPSKPNVTIDTNRATNKWRNLILSTTPMPTTSNADCTKCDPQASPVPVGTVGTFEGAFYYHCGCYRPEFDCRMRALNNTFCAVCQQQIRQTLSPYIVPTSVNLTTPSIAFTDIPEGIGGTGVTTYRAIVFEITSCTPITLQIIVGPTGGFGTPLGTSVVVQPSEFTPVGIGRLWLSYTSTTACSSSAGSVTVHCVETGQTWVIDISAHTIARPKSAVMLVLDRSGSMVTDAGNGHQRVELLRTAVSTFVDVMQQGDGLGIVRFDNLVDTLMAVTDVGPAPSGVGRIQAQNIVASHDPATTLDPRGSTSIGGGIQQAKLALDAASSMYTVRAMVVLTDGLENTPPMIADVSSSLTANTFAIGFGQAASISTAALNAITQGHGGYLVITGPITPDESFALTEYFLKIQAGVNNSTTVLDPRGELIYGVTHRIPFTLTDADMGVDVILLSPAPYYIDFKLQTPDGKIIDPSLAGAEPAIQFISTGRVSYYRASLPMLASDAAGSHAGQWYALLGLSDKARGVDAEFMKELRGPSLPYSLLVHAYSNLQFKPSVLQKSFEPGAEVKVLVALNQYDVPLEKHASVWAEIKRPDGTDVILALPETEAGRFGAGFIASLTGVYTVRVRVQGTTLEGQTFQREQKLTAVVFPGGDQIPSQDGNDRLCRLLSCLLNEKVLDREFAKSLEAKGINLRALKECVKMYCRETQSRLGGEHEYIPSEAAAQITPGFDVSRLLGQPEIRSAIIAILRELKATQGTLGFAELKEGESTHRE
jgi:hypothetical protein